MPISCDNPSRSRDDSSLRNFADGCLVESQIEPGGARSVDRAMKTPQTQNDPMIIAVRRSKPIAMSIVEYTNLTRHPS
jgi:hypothetical protein